MSHHWLAIVSKTHVEKGVEGGFAQVCHGQRGPLSKMKPDDTIIYYSPGILMGESNLKSFTALGEIIDDHVYEFKMSEDFIPFRRKIKYLKTKDIKIEQLKSQLDLCKSKNWGIQLRSGLLLLSNHDYDLISSAMNSKPYEKI